MRAAAADVAHIPRLYSEFIIQYSIDFDQLMHSSKRLFANEGSCQLSQPIEIKGIVTSYNYELVDADYCCK